ncbi:Lactose transport system permease protein LacG [Paenibacillus sp. P1XP2]|nr:Lactose transport system permease protein LacG [Paenibacillus sp. P1XP2]
MPFIRRNISKLITTVLMGALSVFFLIPFVWMVSSAFKFEKDVMRFPIEWIPKSINVVYNFKAVWMGKVPFLHIYFNSIKVAVIVTFITLLVSTMAAYSFTKLKFRGRNLVFTALLAFMIIPDQATLIPRFMLIRWMGLYDTHVALIFMSMFSIYFTFLLRQFMVGISDEYIEAAKIDGAGHFRTFASIIVPLCRPVLATVAIIKFIWSWNDYQNPLIFLQTKDLYTIPLGMTLFRDDYTTNDAS